MSKLCQNCGAIPLQGARFCRACGAPIKVLASQGASDTVSPLAQTIPLADEGRPTDSISPEMGHVATDTGKVMQEELNRLLKAEAVTVHDARLNVSADGAHDLTDSNAATQASGNGEAQTAQPSSVVSKGKPASPSLRIWQAAAIILLCIALTASALAYFYSRQSATVDAGNSPPISISDQKKLVEEQLSEADSLLAAGDVDGAIAKLRYAVKIDPQNSEAHRRLGLALERKGERREAINEYRAATESDASSTAAWRALAAAQFAEGLYSDSVESYARIISAMSEQEMDDNLRLEYADALRLAGRTEDARALYQKVSSSESLDLARRAEEELARLPAPSQQTGESAQSDARNQNSGAAQTGANMSQGNTASVQANNAPPVSDHQVATVVANRPPAEDSNNAERFYNEAVNIVQGRDVKTLQRAELLRALQLFQNIRTGPHAGDAKKYADRLGKEYDRRRKKD